MPLDITECLREVMICLFGENQIRSRWGCHVQVFTVDGLMADSVKVVVCTVVKVISTQRAWPRDHNIPPTKLIKTQLGRIRYVQSFLLASYSIGQNAYLLFAYKRPFAKKKGPLPTLLTFNITWRPRESAATQGCNRYILRITFHWSVVFSK
jgi:hypothetical protein